jgi:hypothetical protein
MTRLETWVAVSTTRAPVPGQFVATPAQRPVTAEAVVPGRRSPFVRGLFAVFGVIGIVLLVPIFVVALPVALIWRAILATTVWKRQSDHATDRKKTSAFPRWPVWK